MNVLETVEAAPPYNYRKENAWQGNSNIFLHMTLNTNVLNPNRSLEKASCHFLMTAIRKTALYMLDS